MDCATGGSMLNLINLYSFLRSLEFIAYHLVRDVDAYALLEAASSELVSAEVREGDPVDTLRDRQRYYATGKGDSKTMRQLSTACSLVAALIEAGNDGAALATALRDHGVDVDTLASASRFGSVADFWRQVSAVPRSAQCAAQVSVDRVRAASASSPSLGGGAADPAVLGGVPFEWVKVKDVQPGDLILIGGEIAIRVATIGHRTCDVTGNHVADVTGVQLLVSHWDSEQKPFASDISGGDWKVARLIETSGVGAYPGKPRPGADPVLPAPPSAAQPSAAPEPFCDERHGVAEQE